MDVDLARALLIHRADVNRSNSDGISPLREALVSAAAPSLKREMVLLLLEQKADPGLTLCEFAKAGWLRPLQFAFDCGVDIDAPIHQKEDNSLLSYAAAHSMSAVAFLLDAKADVNYANQLGSTALTRALKKEDKYNICRMLVARGARMDKGWVLGFAAQLRPVHVFEFLCNAKADVNVRSPEKGRTVLMQVVMRDDRSVRDGMLKSLASRARGIDWLAVDREGDGFLEFLQKGDGGPLDSITRILADIWLTLAFPAVLARIVYTYAFPEGM